MMNSPHILSPWLPMASLAPQHGQEGLGSLCQGFGVLLQSLSVLTLEFWVPPPSFWGTPGFWRIPLTYPYLHRPMQPLQPPGGAHEGVSSTAGFGIGEGPVLALLDTPGLPGVVPSVWGNNEGAALTRQGPPAPHNGAEPPLHLNEGARRGEHPPWGAARWPCELGGAGRRQPGALRCFPGSSSSSALGTSRSSVRALRGTLVTAAGTAPGSGSGRPRGLGVLLAGTPP